MCFVFVTSQIATADGCNNADKQSSCDQLATVVDMRSLDACGFLLELEDGRKLLPQFDVKLGFKMIPGQRVRISFEEAKDQMSICMAEDLIGHISCIQLTGVIMVDDCETFIDPFDIQWSKNVMLKYDPKLVEQHSVEGKLYFHYMTFDGIRVIYSCEGEELCRAMNAKDNSCASYTAIESDIKVIYVLDR